MTGRVAMMRRGVVAAAAAVTVGLLSGCGGSGGPSEDCTAMTDEQLQAVAEGLQHKAELPRGFLYPIPEGEQDLGYTELAAVEIKDPESTEQGTLATSDAGNLLAVDNMARLFFDWGAATTDDSPAGVWRDGMVGSETEQAAKDCLG